MALTATLITATIMAVSVQRGGVNKYTNGRKLCPELITMLITPSLRADGGERGGGGGGRGGRGKYREMQNVMQKKLYYT